MSRSAHCVTFHLVCPASETLSNPSSNPGTTPCRSGMRNAVLTEQVSPSYLSVVSTSRIQQPPSFGTSHVATLRMSPQLQLFKLGHLGVHPGATATPRHGGQGKYPACSPSFCVSLGNDGAGSRHVLKTRGYSHHAFIHSFIYSGTY